MGSEVQDGTGPISQLGWLGEASWREKSERHDLIILQ